MYSVSYRYNPNTSNPYSVYKQPNPNIHIFYSVHKKRNYSFPYKFGFGRIIRIRYIPILLIIRSCHVPYSHLGHKDIWLILWARVKSPLGNYKITGRILSFIWDIETVKRCLINTLLYFLDMIINFCIRRLF